MALCGAECHLLDQTRFVDFAELQEIVPPVNPGAINYMRARKVPRTWRP